MQETLIYGIKQSTETQPDPRGLTDEDKTDNQDPKIDWDAGDAENVLRKEGDPE